MDYINFEANSSEAKYLLDKSAQKGYNQKRKVVLLADTASTTPKAVPEKLNTSGTYIGSADIGGNEAKPEKLEMNGAYIGTASLNETKPKETTDTSYKAEKISLSDAQKMVDYLYDDNNVKNSEEFLTRNDYPTKNERDMNKEYYGEDAEKNHLYATFKDRTNEAFNPKLPDATDRLFLSGFLGDEREQAEYDSKVSAVQKAKDDILNQFKNTEFGYLFAGAETNPLTVTNAINKGPNAPVKMTDALNRNSRADIVTTQFANKNNKGKDKEDIAEIAENIKKLPLVKNPYIHRWVWNKGAETYLTYKGYNISAMLLKHSLKDNPKDIYMTDSNPICDLVKNDPAFAKKMGEAIAKSNGKTVSGTMGVVFENGDLAYSIHTANIRFSGSKAGDGSWVIHVAFDDEYDFTELLTRKKGVSLGNVANDAAAVSQEIGAITPFHVYVAFTMRWKGK